MRTFCVSHVTLGRFLIALLLFLMLACSCGSSPSRDSISSETADPSDALLAIPGLDRDTIRACVESVPAAELRSEIDSCSAGKVGNCLFMYKVFSSCAINAGDNDSPITLQLLLWDIAGRYQDMACNGRPRDEAGPACVEVGLTILHRSDIPKNSNYYFRRACDLGAARGCSYSVFLDYMHKKMVGSANREDALGAVKALEKICSDTSDHLACFKMWEHTCEGEHLEEPLWDVYSELQNARSNGKETTDSGLEKKNCAD